MALQNFIDKATVVAASWLNQVDVLKETIFSAAVDKPSARVALTSDTPMEIGNGGTGARSAQQALTNLGITGLLPNLVATSAEVAAGVTPSNVTLPVGANWAYISRYAGNLTQALAVAGSGVFTLYIDMGVTVSANTVVPATCTLIFVGAGTITTQTGKTLTINSPIVSYLPSTIIFPGPGTYVYGASALLVIGGQIQASTLLVTGQIQSSALLVTGQIQSSTLLVTGQIQSNGIALMATKGVDEARSTNAVSNDSALSITIPAAGGYTIEAGISVQGGAGGIALDMNFSGTFTGSFVSWFGVQGMLNGAFASFLAQRVNVPAQAAQLTQATLAATGDYIGISGFLNAVSAGTFAFDWGQNTTNATATTVKRGSWLKLTQAPGV